MSSEPTTIPAAEETPTVVPAPEVPEVRLGRGGQPRHRRLMVEESDQESDTGEVAVEVTVEAADSITVGGGLVPLMPHHWEDMRTEAASKHAFLGYGWMDMRFSSPKRGPFRFQEWNPRQVDDGMVSQLLKSFRDMGQHRIHAINRFGADALKASIKAAKEQAKKRRAAMAKSKKDAKKADQSTAEDGEDGEAILEAEMDEEWMDAATTTMEVNDLAVENNARIVRWLAQNKNRPEKAEGEGERFLIGLERLRDALASASARRQLTDRDRQSVMKGAISGVSKKWAAEKLLTTPYVVDTVFHLQRMGGHFRKWEFFNSMALQSMFLGVHGKMLSSIVRECLTFWDNIFAPTEFLSMKQVKAVVAEMFLDDSLRKDESDSAWKKRKKTGLNAAGRLLNSLASEPPVRVMYDFLHQTTFLDAVDETYLETLGQVEWAALLGIPPETDHEYDKVFDEYVKGVMLAVDRNLILDKISFAEDAEDLAQTVLDNIKAKIWCVLKIPVHGEGFPQMPLMTSSVLAQLNRILTEIDVGLAEVFRWFEPAYDINRANSTKDGWRDQSDALFSWFRKHDSEWELGAEHTFGMFCRGVFGARRPGIYQLQWALYQRKCKYVERPVQKAEYSAIWKDFGGPGIRLKAAWRGRGKDLVESTGTPWTPDTLLSDFRTRMTDFCQFLLGKSSAGEVKRETIKDLPPLQFYRDTSWDWASDKNPKRAASLHGLVACVKYGIVFSTRPFALSLPLVDDIRILMQKILGHARKTGQIKEYPDMLYLSAEVARQKTLPFEPNPEFHNPEWLLKDIMDMKQETADKKTAVAAIMRVLNLPMAQPVREISSKDRRVLPQWSGPSRGAALDLRKKVSKNVRDAAEALLDALVVNAAQQRLQEYHLDLEFPFVVEEDVSYPKLPLIATWEDRFTFQTAKQLEAWNEKQPAARVKRDSVASVIHASKKAGPSTSGTGGREQTSDVAVTEEEAEAAAAAEEEAEELEALQAEKKAEHRAKAEAAKKVAKKSLSEVKAEAQAAARLRAAQKNKDGRRARREVLVVDSDSAPESDAGEEDGGPVVDEDTDMDAEGEDNMQEGSSLIPRGDGRSEASSVPASTPATLSENLPGSTDDENNRDSQAGVSGAGEVGTQETVATEASDASAGVEAAMAQVSMTDSDPIEAANTSFMDDEPMSPIEEDSDSLPSRPRTPSKEDDDATPTKRGTADLSPDARDLGQRGSLRTGGGHQPRLAGVGADAGAGAGADADAEAGQGEERKGKGGRRKARRALSL
ncbi:hypothetical protein DENSPDRAFT_855547 [Dentipellis sp. KUC8613]|nr:hypothetical protein DENSPDRAFT_855547 [Dentipellis sp. KUC8613]